MRSLWLLTAAILTANLYAQTNPAPVVQMLVPGFVVEELPIKLSNQNNLRFAPDGSLTSLGYDGKIWRLRDTDGDGLEDAASPFWDKPTLSVPVGMTWSTHGLFVSSKGKVSLLRDTNGNGQANVEEIVASGWPRTDVGSGGVDATAVTLDAEGNAYFGLMVADYSNGYRVRKRKDLKPAEIEWLKEQGRWREPATGSGAEDEFSLYDLNSRRGTIQKWDPRTRKLTTVATGIRVPVALAFNRSGDLFNTDQEGETWMPNGNPFDELNHIIPGRNYGFPPAHERWLPGLESERPVVAFGPQHQSACGLVFNEPHPPLNVGKATSDVALPASPERGLFGPREWEGSAFVAGESRARIWRVPLTKTANGYFGTAQTIARVSMLTMDVAISPRGDLYLACHSGPPDWGTGPQGQGKLFRIAYRETNAPVPLQAWPASATEVRIHFNQPLHENVAKHFQPTNASIEFGEYVSAGDRYEVLEPPYAVVQQQDATPRGRLPVHQATLEEGGRTLVLMTEPHPFLTRYALRLTGIYSATQSPSAATAIEMDYDLTHASSPFPESTREATRVSWERPLPWAPARRASAGTDSRAPRKPDGDWETGRNLFTQLQCAKCHRVRGEGGLAGPDLSNLVHRDAGSVLRDIQEPSATIHPDYVTYQIELKDGEAVQGFIRSQNTETVQLFDVDGKETVFARTNIQSLKPTELSLMPSGLLEGRKTNDVRDLLTYLLWEVPTHSVESVEKILARTSPARPPASEQKDMRIVLVASKQDHGAGQHDYPAWQTNWATWLQDREGKIVTETAWQWPDAAQFEKASVIVFYFWNHNWSAERLAELDAYLERGGGAVFIHAAVIADKEPETLAKRIGLSAQPKRTSYRHMPFELRFTDREHPITRGLPEKMDLLDEPYWPMIGDTNTVQILASARVDGAPRPLIWTFEPGKGRVFVSVPGHYTHSLNDPLFRVILLRGISWAAGEDASRLERLGLGNQ